MVDCIDKSFRGDVDDGETAVSLAAFVFRLLIAGGCVAVIGDAAGLLMGFKSALDAERGGAAGSISKELDLYRGRGLSHVVGVVF